MSDVLTRSLIPARFISDSQPKYDQEIVVHWLEQEVHCNDRDGTLKPVLDRLRGWRNREVYVYIKVTSDDWWSRFFEMSGVF